MAEVCDLCHARALEPAYWPERSGRDTVVHLCNQCGLVQSLPRGQSATQTAAISGVGVPRHRKGNRTTACMKILRAHADLNGVLSILDVGAHRGAFTRAVLDAAPRSRVTAVEPDAELAADLAERDRIQPIRARIEDTSLASETFDIIHCSDTIQRLASPATVLTRLWRALKPGGLLIVDAPNIASIGGTDIVEEWFGDKHNYHFSPVTLGRALDAAGFAIIGGPNPMDRENLTFAALKRAVAHNRVPKDVGEVARASALIASYSGARAQNLVALTAVAAELRRLTPRRVAVWGAGRLFDAVVTHGGFDAKSLALLVDGHMTARFRERHGVALARPEALETASPGVIVVMSRTFAREIARMAHRLAPKAEIILYSDLLSTARLALAA